MLKAVFRRAFLRLVAVLALFLAAMPLTAQEPAGPGAEPVPLPGLWPVEARLEAPDLSKIRSIRFLTETGYPPFNYLDRDGRLVGFNVDLARVICTELKLECIIRTRAWEDLFEQLDAGAGDAIIASLAITAENRARVDFTDRYYLTPARFAVREDFGEAAMTPEGLVGRGIGVIAGTAHEAYIEQFFPRSKIVRFQAREDAHLGLQDGTVDTLFDDAMSLMFWINGTASEGCCGFRGGAYYDQRYFGEGVGIGVTKGNDALRKALNYGLRKIVQNGKYRELFLRYFPMSYY